MDRPATAPVKLFDLIRASRTFDELPKSRKLQLAAVSTLGALLCAAAWGAAAGSCVPWLAVANLVKLPIIVLLSAVAAAPIGLVAWKLLGDETRLTDLLFAHARSLLAGSLVLGTFVPLVALYYHSSRFAGPLLADGTALVSLALGGYVFVRLALRARCTSHIAVRLGVPAAILLVQLAAMLQLVAMASPILPDPTMFRRGVDGLVEVRSAERAP
ncbi:MAG: hypothetical protein HOW73_17325 [Polyangiaceae bacterium]|nr:hypothetical protein [Polyangiaceae bacterium]